MADQDTLLQEQAPPKPFTLGIVGGGIAGLCSALLVRKYIPQCSVKIFEASDRVGGRIHTYRFSDKPYQYFEAGAMRIPKVPEQKRVFDLIDYLNDEQKEFPLKLIPYHCSCPKGNRVYVNGMKQADGKVMSVAYADKYPQELGFPPKAGATKQARKLLRKALEPVLKKLHKDFDKALKRYDSMTLNYYLSQELGWTDDRINYVEVMTSQTNEFQSGLIEQAILNSYFIGTEDETTEWKTIDGGMSRLPEAAARLFGEENIVLHANITSVHYITKELVTLGYSKAGYDHEEMFDAVILALPPSSVHMIPNRPRWSVNFEHCLRSINFQPLYRLGLRFNSRFWEREDLRPSKGGQSITDLPSRWVVYPSYGIGDTGKGVLLTYSWMTDATFLLPTSLEMKIKMALKDLQELYPEVDVAGEYAGGRPGDESFLKEAVPFTWGVGNPGYASFYAGQFTAFYDTMVEPQGNIYFAGEHLSRNHGWMSGALESAHETVQRLANNHSRGTKIEFFYDSE